MRDNTSAQSPLSLAMLVVTTALAMRLFGMSGSAEQPSERPLTSAPARADSYYAAASRVQVTEPMAGDIIVAGREIDVGQPVAGDILAAGWRVVLSARADDDVRIAGGLVD
jgi:hypothetical protein